MEEMSTDVIDGATGKRVRTKPTTVACAECGKPWGTLVRRGERLVHAHHLGSDPARKRPTFKAPKWSAR